MGKKYNRIDWKEKKEMSSRELLDEVKANQNIINTVRKMNVLGNLDEDSAELGNELMSENIDLIDEHISRN